MIERTSIFEFGRNTKKGTIHYNTKEIYRKLSLRDDSFMERPANDISARLLAGSALPSNTSRREFIRSPNRSRREPGSWKEARSNADIFSDKSDSKDLNMQKQNRTNEWVKI
jgi:hypothetical protein